MSDSLVGAILDTRYELHRLVAHGGMGLIFEAHHRFTRRTVAVKLLPEAYRHLKEARSRLLREAHALTAVRHPGFVEVLDAGVCTEHGPYVVLEMLEGRTLDGILASRRRLTIAEAVHMGARVCEALTHAHSRGVVHRDLKPANVFVARSDLGSERITLIDLGVAAVADEKLAQTDRKLTTAHEVLGTPEYMAPEQLWGREIDARTDVYAIGMTIFECLTGDVPYVGAYPDVLVQVSNASAPPSVRERREEVPATLAMVIEHALEKEPGARFQSAAELGRALLAASPVGSTAPSLLSIAADEAPDSGERGPKMESGERGIRPGAAERPLKPDGGETALKPDSPKVEPEPVEQAIKLVRRKAPRADRESKPQASSPIHRRLLPRAPYVTPAVLEPPGDVNVDGRIEEISEEGVLVVAPISFPLGMKLLLRFACPVTGEMVAVSGSIRWIREGRGKSALGIEFEEIEPAFRSAVRDYVSAPHSGYVAP